MKLALVVLDQAMDAPLGGDARVETQGIHAHHGAGLHLTSNQGLEHPQEVLRAKEMRYLWQ